MTVKDARAPSLPVSGGSLEDLARPPDEEPGAPEERAQGVVATTLPSAHEAELVRLHLEVEGVEAWLVDEHTVSIAGHLTHAVGGVKVVVAKDDLERARELVRTRPDRELPDEAWGGRAPGPDDDTVARSEATTLANRALAAAVLGTFVPPLGNLYSLWVLYLFGRERQGATAADVVKAVCALAFDALVIALVVAFAIEWGPW